MSSVGSLTGKDGKFVVGTYLVARVTQWVVSPKLASTSEWGDSDSAGYTNRAPGRKDSTYTAEGKFDYNTQVFDIFQPGDYAKSVLWMTPGQNTPVSIPALYWLFPSSLCQEFQLTVNIDTEEVESWTSSWGADGIFYKPGDPAAPSQTVPVLQNV